MPSDSRRPCSTPSSPNVPCTIAKITSAPAACQAVKNESTISGVRAALLPGLMPSRSSSFGGRESWRSSSAFEADGTCQTASFPTKSGIASYVSWGRFSRRHAAETNDTPCSRDGPPKTTPTRRRARTRGAELTRSPERHEPRRIDALERRDRPDEILSDRTVRPVDPNDGGRPTIPPSGESEIRDVDPARPEQRSDAPDDARHVPVRDHEERPLGRELERETVDGHDPAGPVAEQRSRRAPVARGDGDETRVASRVLAHGVRDRDPVQLRERNRVHDVDAFGERRDDALHGGDDAGLPNRLGNSRKRDGEPVSYTHLTLPTNREV